MNIVGIIPARGGSKGLPGKNIKPLAGRPLIAYTIEAALKSKLLNRVIVSTDDKKIAEIAEKYGAEVPFLRPKRLAGDSTSIASVLKQAVRWLEDNEHYLTALVVALQPTSPLRTAKDIDKAVALFLNSQSETVVSVYQPKCLPYWLFQRNRKYLKPIAGWKYLKMRRQDLAKSYLPNGALFISTPKILDKYKSFYTTRTLPYLMPIEKSIDIDTEIDFRLAESMIRQSGITLK